MNNYQYDTITRTLTCNTTGPHSIYEVVGRGKHSTVYKGRKKKTLVYYAIKSVDKQQRQRVLQEVRTMHALQHPNVLSFHAWYETTNHLWLILEFCVGGDLVSLLAKDTRLPEDAVHDMGRDLLTALVHLHHKGIIYCDLKPSNVLLDENGRIKLGGFGLSRRLTDINQQPVGSLPPAKRGTPCYMAPELFEEGATHSTASDLWAAGCVLYECLTGQPPFVKRTLAQLMGAILHEQHGPLEGVSPELCDLVGRMLDKNPATRITWAEVAAHPFWQAPLPLPELPPEPSLERFIDQHCRPAPRTTAPPRRASVNVLRLSHIARHNLEGHKGGYEAVAAVGPGDDVQLNDPDAELDFEERDDDTRGTVGDRDSDSSQAGAGSGAAEPQSPMRGSVRGPPPQEAPTPLHPQQRRHNATAPAEPVGNNTAVQHEAPPQQQDQPPRPRPSPAHCSGVAAAMWHPSDSLVRPIVGNSRIERIPEPSWDPTALPCAPLTRRQMASLDRRERSTMLAALGRCLQSPTAHARIKANALAYLQHTCGDGACANVLLATQLPTQLLSMLRVQPDPPHVALHVHAVTMLGLMVRHALVVPDELATAGLLGVLLQGLQGRAGDPLRRAYAATFGEVLFYVASQTGAQSSVWKLPERTLGTLCDLLLNSGDPIVQQYILKTVENIASQDGPWTTMLASDDMLAALCTLWVDADADQATHPPSAAAAAVQASAASALSRLLRWVPQAAPQAVQLLELCTLLHGLQRAQPKLQLASLSVVCCALAAPSPPLRDVLLADGAVADALWPLLSHDSPGVRGKAAAAVALMGRENATWLVEMCSSKAFAQLEKLARDADAFVQQVMAAVAPELAANTDQLMHMVAQGIAGQLGQLSPTSRVGPASLLLVVLHWLSSPWLRPCCVGRDLLQQLAGCLQGLHAPPALTPEAAGQAMEVLLHVVEALFQQPAALQQHHAAALTALVPSLASWVPAQDREVGVMATKLLCDLLLVLLWEPACCCYGEEQGQGEDGHSLGEANELMDAAVQRDVLPLLPQLLRGDDPLPLYALRMLGALLQVAPHWAPAVAELGLVPLFFQFLSVDSPHNNVHNLRVCTQLVLHDCAPPPLLRQHDSVRKVVSVLRYALANSVEPFMEPLLELAIALLTLERLQQDAALEGPTGGGVGTQGMVAVVGDVLAVCGQGDAVWSRLAVEVVSLFAEAHPGDAAAALLQPPVLQLLGDALQQEYSDAELSLEVKHHLLTAVAACLASADEEQIDCFREVFSGMRGVLEGVAAAATGPLRQLATELYHVVA